MKNMTEEDGFQEAGGEKGRRKRETGPRQTSEGKQKLMKQDVTIDGSLHPSKHGTLTGCTLTPPLSFSLFLSPSLRRSYKICSCLTNLTIAFEALSWLSSCYNKSLQFSVAALLIGPLIFTYKCVYISRSIELGLITSLGAEYLRRLSTLGHKLAQIRWIQLRVFTLYSTCIQYLSPCCTHPVARYHDSGPAWRWGERRLWCHINGSKIWDQKATLICKSLVWETNSKAQSLLVLKLTHYLVTLHTMSISHTHWPHPRDEPIRTWGWRKYGRTLHTII